MMNINRVKIVIFSSFIALITSCSGYNELLKSGNSELMYKAALDYFEQEKYPRVITLLGEVDHIYTGTDREDSIAYYVARSYYETGDMASSGSLFDNFRRKFSRSIFIEDVEYMYAKGFYYASPGSDRDQADTRSAILAIKEYLDRYPNSVKKEVLLENIEELTQKLHDKSFYNAKTYYKIGRHQSAVVALKNASREYPESRHVEELLYLVVKSNYLFASNSYQIHQRDRYLDMLDAYYTFVSEYPESKHRNEVDKMLKVGKEYIETFKDKSLDGGSTTEGEATQEQENIEKNENTYNTESNDGN